MNTKKKGICFTEFLKVVNILLRNDMLKNIANYFSRHKFKKGTLLK